ncbi:MAG TPA: UDP-2,3-diacylglucosamine diphosphatase [Chitinophagaceae bacterium]|nr:UDP-2,3-diacylglucosamine diphosphatase [Chitinophagaceae bacterium]
MSTSEHTPIRLTCPKGKKIYFASDFHLGSPDNQSSREREQKVVNWLNKCTDDAAHIFLVGDIFDFWFEYKSVIPKGFTRLFGKLADLTDHGVGVSFFTGNHDMWMKDYFKDELNIQIFDDRQVYYIRDKKILVAHGDGLGPGDKGYKFLKKVLRNKFTKTLFSIIRPHWGLSIANKFSKTSRGITEEKKFLGEDNEWLVQYSKEVLQKEDIDFFIFGHRHVPIDFPLSNSSRMINLGDWITNFTYAVFDGEEMELKKHEL